MINGWARAREQQEGRLSTTRWPREAVGDPYSCLEGIGVETRRQVGGSQEDTRKPEDDAVEALSVRILLRRVRLTATGGFAGWTGTRESGGR